MSYGWYCRSLVRIWFNCREVFQNQIPRPLLVEHSWGSAWSSSALYSSPSPPSSFAWSSQLATFSTPSISAKASRSTPPVSPSPIWSWETKNQNFQKYFCLEVAPLRICWLLSGGDIMKPDGPSPSPSPSLSPSPTPSPGECFQGLGDPDPLVQDIVLHQVGPQQLLHDPSHFYVNCGKCVTKLWKRRGNKI